MSKHIFGPVPSRRLGLSLGIDLVPYKTCSLDCIYCECGKTNNLTKIRKKWFDADAILKELKVKIDRAHKIDYITFSGSGEPTLSEDIGYLIKKIKAEYKLPVCVLTNGTLLYQQKVRNNLLDADIVMPSLDAASEKVFKLINRPVSGLKINTIINGLIDFRTIFKGKIFLEILFVKGINDSEFEINKLSEAADKIMPDKIQLNTCVRPGTETDIKQLSENELNIIAKKFNLPVEIISTFNKNNITIVDNTEIIDLIKRRPCTIRDISSITSLPALQVLKMIEFMKFEGVKVIDKKIGEETFYLISQE